jgi:hypothetical protein
MIDKRAQADRLLIAELTGEAGHRAKWRELTEDEEAAAVAALRELAGGRADLLAEVAGVLEGTSDGKRRGADARPRRGSRRSPEACTAGERRPSRR